MGASFPEAKVELGRQATVTLTPLCAYARLRCRRHQARGAQGFRWLYRRGPTRSHPEHGSQALQSRWYCTLCVWESRSLPEFFPRRPAARKSRGASPFQLTNVSGERGRGKAARENFWFLKKPNSRAPVPPALP